MTKNIKLLSLLLLLVFSAVLILYKHTEKKLDKQIVTTHSMEKQFLFFSGKIEPVVLSTVSSPIEGKVVAVNVKYGDKIKKGEVLFELQANGEEDQTVDIIVDYLKNRDEINLADTKLKNEKKLLDAGIIAKNEYVDIKRKRDIGYIDYVKARTKIEDLGQIIGIDINDIDKISLDDIPAITRIMKMHHKIPIRAEYDGVFLHGAVKDLVEIIPGIDLKKGSAVGVIGDTREVKINLSVPEIDINKIKVGQKVDITGSGFKGITLAGKVVSINLFNFDGSIDSGEVTYPVTILVPNFTDEIRAIVHVGMSAKIAISEEVTDRVFVPINAVKQDKTSEYVMKVTNTGSTVKQPVIVGRTTAKDIEIIAGLNNGEKVSLVD